MRFLVQQPWSNSGYTISRPCGSFLPRREQQLSNVMDESDSYEKLLIDKSTDMEICGFHVG